MKLPVATPTCILFRRYHGSHMPSLITAAAHLGLAFGVSFVTSTAIYRFSIAFPFQLTMRIFVVC